MMSTAPVSFIRTFYPTGGSVWRRDFRRRTFHSVKSVAAMDNGPNSANRQAMVHADGGWLTEIISHVDLVT